VASGSLIVHSGKDGGFLAGELLADLGIPASLVPLSRREAGRERISDGGYSAPDLSKLIFSTGQFGQHMKLSLTPATRAKSPESIYQSVHAGLTLGCNRRAASPRLAIG
jgi:hypothetical protein